MKRKLLLDISTIYSIRATIIDKITELAEACICDYIVETKLNDDDLLEINIGIGKLSLLILKDSIEYQFIPSNKLEKLIINTVTSMKSPLINISEEGIEQKLISTYKELF